MTARTDRAPERSAGRDRLRGVDAARAVALAGMVATHILPLTAADGTRTLTGLVASGRASALFAVLAGVGIALATGGTRPPEDGRAHAAAATGLVVRGVLVGLLGLALGGLQPPVAVILAYYGLLFVVAAPLLRLRAPALAGLAVLSCALGPVLSHLLRQGRPTRPGEQAGLGDLAEPLALLDTLAVTGYYPALPWTAYLFAGMAVGRLDLRRPRVAAALLGGGAVLAVVAAAVSAALAPAAAAVIGDDIDRRAYGTTPSTTWWWLTVDDPHTGTPPDLAHTTGTALVVLGALLLLARWAPRVVWLPAALGAVPLTVYALHGVAVSLYDDGSVALWAAHLLVATALGAALAVAGWRGPLEAVLAAASRAARRVVAPSPPPRHRRAAPAGPQDPAGPPPGPSPG